LPGDGQTQQKLASGDEKMTSKLPEKMNDECLTDWLVNFKHGVPTQKEAIRRSKLVMKEARELGAELGKWCLKYTRCKYFHCNVCRRSQQLRLMCEMQRFETEWLKSQCKPKCWRAITILPENGFCKLQELPEGGIREFGQQVSKTLKTHAPRIQGVFVIEPSVNIDQNGISRCQWHVHGIFNRIKRKEYMAIQKAFAWTDQRETGDLLQWFTPVLQQKVTNFCGQVAYMAKAQIRLGREVGGKRRNTAKGIPSCKQEALIAAALFPETIDKRLIFIDMEGVKDGLNHML
jgi:hypothetical protein